MQQVCLRPGVLFWKNGDKYYIFDQVSLEQFRINKSAYEILSQSNGNRSVDEIADHLLKTFKYKNDDAYQYVRNDIMTFIDLMIKKGYMLKDVDLHRAFYDYLRGEDAQAIFTPGLVYWEVTNACNRNCVMCYNPSSELLKDELTFEQGVKLISELHDMGVSCIIFTGGEPIIRSKDVIGWIKHCSSLNIQTEIFTNGTLITEEIAQELASAGLGYCRVSIHGATDKTHDYVTQVPGSYKLATTGISNLVAADIKTAWSIVANKRNFDELRNVIVNAIKLKCHGVVVGSLDLIGRGALQKELELEPNQEASLWRFLDESICFYGDKIRFSWGSDMCKDEAWEYYVTNPELPQEEWKFDPNHYMRFVKNSLCGVGQRSLAITASGNITPCPALYDIVLGNCKNDNVKSVWENAEPFVEFREKLLEDFEKCGSCGMRYACVGGCRANAFHGDNALFGRDLRRCKVHAKRGAGNLDMNYSFYSQNELDDIDKYINNRNIDKTERIETFNSIISEGKGPWIPYVGIINRIKYKMEVGKND